MAHELMAVMLHSNERPIGGKRATSVMDYRLAFGVIDGIDKIVFFLGILPGERADALQRTIA